MLGNMDHAIAQGLECVNRVLLGDVCTDFTWQAKRRTLTPIRSMSPKPDQ